MDKDFQTTANLLDTVETGFCVFDGDGQPVLANRTFLRFFPEYTAGAPRPAGWPHGQECLFQHHERWLHGSSACLPGGGRTQVVVALPASEACDSAQRIRHAFNQSFIPTLLAEPGGRLIDVNDALCELLGYRREEMHCLGMADIVERCAVEQVMAGLTRPGEGPQAPRVIEREVDFRRKDDSLGCCQFFCAAVFDPQARRQHIVGHLIDISRRKSEEQARERLFDALRHEAGQDELTGLANRRHLETELKDLMGVAGSHGLLFIDLDGFKLVNDRAGHAYGDVVLRQVASLLRRTVRGSDVVGRLGGDEFVVLLRDCDAAHVAAVGANLVKVLGRTEFGLGDRLYRIGASIGARTFGDRIETMEAVLLDADGACYRAKKNGRNRVELHA